MAADSRAMESAFGEDAYAREKKLLWPRRWLVVGRVDELPEPAHYFTWERTGVPLLILRSSDGEIRGFYNSCRHRGAPVVREARGRNRALRCQYHSWTYDTLGRLVSVPDERDFVDLRLEERPLVPIRVAEAGSWLLAAEPGVESLPAAAIPDVPDGFRTIRSLSVAANCNWKIAAGQLAAIARAAAGEDGTAVAPNGRLSVNQEFGLGLFAWPTERATCEIQAIVSAPDWGEEGSPADSPQWQARLSALTASIETGGRTAHLEQDAIERGGDSGATGSTLAVVAAVEQLFGGS